MTEHYKQISILKFEAVRKNLPQFVLDEWKKQEFKGFRAGVIEETENYKYDLRKKILKILDVSTWKQNMVGKGEIAQRLLQCFQLKENNLLGDKRGVGEKSLSYYKLILALSDRQGLEIIEQIVFDLFYKEADNQTTFERCIQFFGKKYSVIALLFFIYSDKKYLPISTSNFEHAFKVLGNETKLQRKCSWDNYNNYLNVIKEVKLAIEVQYEEQIYLLDAHSFCWMLGYKNRYSLWLSKKEITTNTDIYRAIDIHPVSTKLSSEKDFVIPELEQDNSYVDWDTLNKKNRLKGIKAEEHVEQYERERLRKEGCPELAEKVENYSNKLGQGFDILSYNNDGSYRKIEVKATDSNSFIITANELKMSQQDSYWIYLVSEKNNEVSIRTLKRPDLNDTDKFTLSPKNYYVSFSI